MMPAMKKRVLFLQLPLLDNDVVAAQEQIPLAGIYLQAALERSSERAWFQALPLPVNLYQLDDTHLACAICRLQPAVVACTLYLWNIERSLHVLARLRRVRPRLKILAGGPEVARDHPFLFHTGVIDVAVIGEGEVVFPEILHALRHHRTTAYQSVGWKIGCRYAWGRREPPVVPLAQVLPPAKYLGLAPDEHGVAYLETSRGCPLRCAYCRYPQERRRLSFLSVPETRKRLEVLRRRGAREVRFIDPTFNAHPQFDAMLRGIATLNRDRRMSFFAELRADWLTPEQAQWLRKANFREIEVGVQSRDPAVLRRIHRPTALPAVTRGIRALTRRGIRVTIDLMYGLPGQTAADLHRSIRWALNIRGGRLQCLQTLILPGTELRRRRREWGLQAMKQPPYGVFATPVLTIAQLEKAMADWQARAGEQTDCPTRRFIGAHLPDLFPEAVGLRLPAVRWPARIPGRQNRRALIFSGTDLFAQRQAIGRLMTMAVATEPQVLWQFILRMHAEEPLDLLDALIDGMKHWPDHLNDRWIRLDAPRKMTARRILVLLEKKRQYNRTWVRAVDERLRRSFY